MKAILLDGFQKSWQRASEEEQKIDIHPNLLNLDSASLEVGEEDWYRAVTTLSFHRRRGLGMGFSPCFATSSSSPSFQAFEAVSSSIESLLQLGQRRFPRNWP